MSCISRHLGSAGAGLRYCFSVDDGTATTTVHLLCVDSLSSREESLHCLWTRGKPSRTSTPTVVELCLRSTWYLNTTNVSLSIPGYEGPCR